MPEVAVDGTGETPAPEKPAWISQLSDDLKGNETFTSFKTISDFAKVHLETVGKVKELDGISSKVTELEGKLSNSIPKLSDKATPEEQAAFRKTMGVPDKPTDYEFPKGEGVEHDPNMVNWAKDVFFEAGLSRPQAALIADKWTSFVKGMVEAEEKIAEDTKTENEANFRKEFKTEDEYKAGYELSKRFWNKVTGTEFDTVYKEADAWQVPMFMRFIFHTAKAMGEDWTPQGTARRGAEVKPGMIYDKTFFPQKNI